LAKRKYGLRGQAQRDTAFYGSSVLDFESAGAASLSRRTPNDYGL